MPIYFLLIFLSLSVPALAEPSTQEILFDLQSTEYEACKNVSESDREKALVGKSELTTKFGLLYRVRAEAAAIGNRQLTISQGMQNCIPVLDELYNSAESSGSIVELSFDQGACVAYIAAFHELSYQIAEKFPAYHEAMYFMSSPSAHAPKPYRALPREIYTYYSGMKPPLLMDYERNFDGSARLDAEGRRRNFHYNDYYRPKLDAHIDNWRTDFVRMKGVDCFLPKDYTTEDRLRVLRDRRCQRFEIEWEAYASKRRKILRKYSLEDYFSALNELPFLGHVDRQFPGYEGIRSGFVQMQKSAENVLDDLDEMGPSESYKDQLPLMAFTPVVNSVLKRETEKGNYEFCAVAEDLQQDYKDTQTLLHAVLKLDWRTISIIAAGATCLAPFIPISWATCLIAAGVAEGGVIMYDGQKRYNQWLDRFFLEFDTEIEELQAGIQTSRLTNVAEGKFRTRYRRYTWALFPVLTFGDVALVKPVLLAKPAAKYVLKLIRPNGKTIHFGLGDAALAGMRAATP